MPQTDPAVRRLQNRAAAQALHAQYDSRELIKPAQRAAQKKLNDRLLAQIDEHEPRLPEAERQRRLGHARSAHYASIQAKSMATRLRKAKRKQRAMENRS